MTSRERLLAALSCQQPDHTPCSFMLYGGLQTASPDYASFLRQQMALGLDTFVEIPPRPPVVVNDHYNLHGLPMSYGPQVHIREWIERVPREEWPIMVKEYVTPDGTLQARVRQTGDWRWGDHVPLFDDYIEPRSAKFLVTQPSDLAALRHLLTPTTRSELEAFRAESEPAIRLARQEGLLLAGGWGVGADVLGWIYGLENMVFAAYDQPDFLAEMLAIVADWNRARQEVLLDTGVELFIKRAWYENTDFWTPRSWRRFIYPMLQADVQAAHARGCQFGYLITSRCMPLLPLFAELGIDVLIGVDPHEWDLAETKRQLAGKVCLWGGVNGHLDIEHGDTELVRRVTREALDVLAPGGGFVLSPVDNVREHTATAQRNVAALIDEWQRYTGQLSELNRLVG
jgi:uroporphyrinogen-III decarboxylase